MDNTENKTIRESNIEIDMFLNGREPVIKSKPEILGKRRGDPGLDTYYDLILVDDLKYHSSLDWLMPVWVKISKLIAPADGIGITVQEIRLVSDNLFEARLNYRTKYDGIGSKHEWFDYTDQDPIRATWCVIVQFIRWYNTQIKK